MNIAILGSRGIPNNYGGFEQFTDVLSQKLVEKGHKVTVYCSDNHPYKEDNYNGVNLVHKFDPEDKIGTAGQFIYDLNCIIHASKQKFDLIYLLGYTSSSVWQRLLQHKSEAVITNMDGLEWNRSKYSFIVRLFLKYAEKLAVKHSDLLIADSVGIQSYLKNKYNILSTYIPYGSYIFNQPDKKYLVKYDLGPYLFDLLISRFEPENNIEMVLDAYSKSKTNRKLLLIGDQKHTKFGTRMFELYNKNKRILFLGHIYDQNILNNFRFFSNLYFHGHSVGGTNPSLLEAMGASALIAYHKNEFNEAVVGQDGFPFSDSKTLTRIIENSQKINYPEYIENNLNKISTVYSWERICDQYEEFFLQHIK